MRDKSYYYKTAHAVMIPIPPSEIEGQIGNMIHLRWARHGAHWKLISIDGETMTLQARVTGKILKNHIGNACYTRRHEPREESEGEEVEGA